MKKTVIILSGGLDSTTLAYYLKDKGHELYALTFNYGQKQKEEISAALTITKQLKISHKIADISSVKDLLKSALTKSDIKVPDGHYAANNMKSTVVPNRNMIMLSIAAGYASSIEAENIAFAAHGGDHFIYADCRPLFVDTLNQALIASFYDDNVKPLIIAPFSNFNKTDIVRIGHMLKVPFELTWSCYKGGKKHCGRCGTDNERKEAFRLAGVPDPTEYEDETGVFRG